MRSLRVLVGFVALFVSGCVGLQSLEGSQDGVVYHLPKSLLTITVRQYHDIENERIWYTIGGPAGTYTPAGATAAKTLEARDIYDETIADPDHRYVIHYRPSALSDDRLCISRKPSGLLHDVQFASDDRTPEIIFNVAKFIGGFVGTPSTVSFRVGDSGDTTIKVKEFTSKVDPFDDGDVRAFQRGLKIAFGANVQLGVARMRKMLEPSAATWPAGCSIKDGCAPEKWAKRCSAENICYRTKLDLPIDLVVDGSAVDVKYAKVINPWDIGAISVTRAALVQKITKLRFEDGALVSAIIRKPSEVEEASLLPLNVMNAILAVPSGLWQGALADQKFKEEAIKTMAANQADIANLNEQHKALLLQGAEAIGPGTAEKYELNCEAGNRGGTFTSAFGG